MNKETKKLLIMLIHGITVVGHGNILKKEYFSNLADAAENAGISIEDLIDDLVD